MNRVRTPGIAISVSYTHLVEGYALDADQLSASGVQPKVDDLNSHGFLPETEMEACLLYTSYGELSACFRVSVFRGG